MKISNTSCAPVPCLKLRLPVCIPVNMDAPRCPKEKGFLVKSISEAILAKPQSTLAHNCSQKPNDKKFDLLKTALSECTGPQSQAKAKPASICVPSSQCSDTFPGGRADPGLLREHLDRAGTLDAK